MKLGLSSRRKALVAAVVLGLAALIAVAAVVLARTWLFVSAQVSAGSPADFDWNEQAAVERFTGASRFPTVSQDEATPENREAFASLIDYLQVVFPEVHATPRREVIGDSLFYTWTGEEAGLDPILLASRIDKERSMRCRIPVTRHTGSNSVWLWPALSRRALIRPGFSIS